MVNNKRSVASMILAVLLAALSWAQTSTTSLRGTVVDRTYRAGQILEEADVVATYRRRIVDARARLRADVGLASEHYRRRARRQGQC